MRAMAQNTRVLRFLVVLGAVAVTIFLYASYSTIASVTPPAPHIHTVGEAASAYSSLVAGSFLLDRQQFQAALNVRRDATSSGEAIANRLLVDTVLSSQNNLNNNNNNINNKNNNNNYLHRLPPAHLHTLPHRREPTVDKDAEADEQAAIAAAEGDADAAAAIGNGLDDVPDEIVLERFAVNGGNSNNNNNIININNDDLLEEAQYVQNVDNVLSNANASGNLAAQQAQSLVDSEHAQSQQQQQQILAKQQQAQQLQLNDNNLNKIADSEVLIPTSNLQKFIESADKILKNITGPAFGATAITATTASAVVNKTSTAVELAASKMLHTKQPKSSDIAEEEDNNNNNNNEEAWAPSVIMTIKKPTVQAQKSTTNAKVKPKPSTVAVAVTKNVNTPKTPVLRGTPTWKIYEHGHRDNEIKAEHLCPQQGKELKLLILITSAQDHQAARLSIRQTWGHYGIRRDVTTAFVLGRTMNVTMDEALRTENHLYGDLIRGNSIDSYNNLTLKTISSLEWVENHCKLAKYVLKTDDDMFINVPKLLSFLDTHSKERRVIFGRLAKKWKPVRNIKSKYYVSPEQFSAAVFPSFTTGPAYVLTSDVVHDLYQRSLEMSYLKLEDVFTTGIVAQELGIRRLHANEFLNRRIAFNPCNVRKAISVHMIKANEQFDLWKKLLDQNTKCK